MTNRPPSASRAQKSSCHAKRELPAPWMSRIAGSVFAPYVSIRSSDGRAPPNSSGTPGRPSLRLRALEVQQRELRLKYAVGSAPGALGRDGQRLLVRLGEQLVQ